MKSRKADNAGRKCLVSQLAVVCLLVHEGKILMLKRNKPPLCWGPPAGRVEEGESILEALHREVKEETGLNCEILMLVNFWEGTHNAQRIVSVSYVCRTTNKKVKLSDEHNSFRWVPIDKIHLWKNKTDMEVSKWEIWVKLAIEYCEELKS